MFTIIGGDGKEYGPVTADQVRAWIAAGRANLDTKAKALGSEEWRRLGDYAEFGATVSAPPPPLTPVAPAAGVGPQPAAATGVAEVPSASRWLRLGAALIDGVLKATCWLPTTRVVWQWMLETVQSGRQPSPFDVLHIISGAVSHSLPFLIGLAVVQAVLLSARGQSIGKLACGLRIVRKADGSQAGFTHAFLLRGVVTWLFEQVPLLGGLFWLVDACFIFGDERRCVHDYIAGTRVVKA